jgi:hypothetical protein
MDMNKKLWNEFLKTPQTKKEKETLGEAVVAIVEETKERLHEGQQGMAFEDVLVAVAKGEESYNKDEAALKKGKRPNKAGGGKWKELTLYDLAMITLRIMGYTDDEITNGVDPNARAVSKSGISGDPKTDVIIKEKNISLKLPGGIQLGSGEGASTKAIFDLVMRATTDVREMVEKSASSVIKKHVEEFLDSLAETTGKRYYPTQSSSVTKGEWKKNVDEQTYEGLLTARAAWDWDHNKYPSDGIPKAWKKGPKGTETEDPQQAIVPSTIGSTKEKRLFPTKEAYVKAFIERAVANQAKQMDKRSWEEIKKTLKDTVNKTVAKVAAEDPLFYDLLIDEYLTGRRQFTNKDHIATWYLSPQGFYPIRTREETAKLAKEIKDYLKWDARGKGRKYLGKAVSFRIDFNQAAYYKAITKALKEEQKKATQDMSEQEEESSTETSLEDKITNNLVTSVLQSIKIS